MRSPPLIKAQTKYHQSPKGKAALKKANRKYRDTEKGRMVHKKIRKNQHQLLLDWYETLKKQLSCKICEESHVACLEFHHLNSANKESSISQLISNKSSKTKILNEIKKCMVLCSNCHKKCHYYAFKNAA